ncbi:hypothetical protein CgunFtcFv8_007779 [Champsocephalus gunnari]|uniref:Uncharacterized protein n=1 Tax=Champsocephalus gunnari TaxID=52237 RepID=A0AAN8H627_CHAGU|nr:hypothetical protein CgunFtcFv8_007779 [Champsocephalus gunnari]
MQDNGQWGVRGEGEMKGNADVIQAEKVKPLEAGTACRGKQRNVEDRRRRRGAEYSRARDWAPQGACRQSHMQGEPLTHTHHNVLDVMLINNTAGWPNQP